MLIIQRNVKTSDRVRLMATLIHDVEDVYEIRFNLPGNANSLNLCVCLTGTVARVRSFQPGSNMRAVRTMWIG